MEDSISEEVAKALALKLTRKEKTLLVKRYTENAEAYEAYLKGRYFFDKRTAEGLGKGIEYFNHALTLDTNYALAYTGLADSYNLLHSYSALPLPESDLMAERAILRALELDDELGEAHASLGHLRTRQWDWSVAEKEFQRAIELNPNYATAHAWFALHLGLTGRFEEAFAETKRAQALDPLSLIINFGAALHLYLTRRYDQAIEQFRRTLELDSDFALAHCCLGYTCEAQGKYDEAAFEYQLAQSRLGNVPEITACLGRIHALSGRRGEAQDAIDELRRLPRKRCGQTGFIALIYTALEDKDEAFRWLELGYTEHDEGLALLKVDPRLDSLRADARFKSLLERVGLADSNHLTSSE